MKQIMGEMILSSWVQLEESATGEESPDKGRESCHSQYRVASPVQREEGYQEQEIRFNS